MLNQGKAMNTSHGIRRVLWNDEQWDLIASELKRRFPTRPSSHYPSFNFSMDEFEEAMEAVLGQEQHKSFDDFMDIKDQLLQAFKRVKKAPTPPVESARIVPKPRVNSWEVEDSKIVSVIRWTPAEYEKVVDELHRILPHIFEDRLDKLHIKDILRAQSVLPSHRHREFKQMMGFKPMALATWDRVSSKMKRPLEAIKPVALIEPAEKKSDSFKAVATAMHEAFKAPVAGKAARKVKVFWTKEEWLLIAREMYRQNPHFAWFTSSFSVVDLPAIREAQREVIPFERRRHIAGNLGLQQPLSAAFKALEAELKAKELHAKADEVDTVSLSIHDSKVDTVGETKAVEIVAQTAVHHEQNAPTQQPAGDLATRFATAATPLISTLMQELAKHLMPEILAALAPVFSGAIEEIKKAATPVYVQPTPQYIVTNAVAKQLPEAPQTIIQDTQKKPKIAILGPMGSQKAELERAYPELRLTFIEGGHGIKEAGANCELFIVSNKHLAGANKAAIKHHVAKEKVRYFDGGITSIKHQINVWKVQNDAAK